MVNNYHSGTKNLHCLVSFGQSHRLWWPNSWADSSYAGSTRAGCFVSGYSQMIGFLIRHDCFEHAESSPLRYLEILILTEGDSHSSLFQATLFPIHAASRSAHASIWLEGQQEWCYAVQKAADVQRISFAESDWRTMKHVASCMSDLDWIEMD